MQTGKNGSRDSARGMEFDKSPKRFGSLRWRILCWMGIVGLGPLLVMAYQGYHCARQAIVESQEAHLRSVLDSRKAGFEARLAEIRADLQVLAVTPCTCEQCAARIGNTTTVSMDMCCNLIEGVCARNTSYRTLIVYDLDWNVLAEAGGNPLDDSTPPPDFRLTLRKAGGFVVESAPASKDGKPRLYAGHPVLAQDENRVGYLVAELDISRMTEPVLQERSGLKKTGKVYLLSSEGDYLNGASGLGDLGAPKNYLPPELLSAQTSNVLQYTDSRGTKVLGVSARIPELNWRMVVEIDWEEAFAWLHVLKIRASITGAVTLILIVILSVKIASRLSQPLRELAAVSQRVAKGRRQERIGYLAGTEAQEVGAAFNKMLDEIETTHRKLVHTASLAAVGQLSSSIVHEMRNPLASVKMNLQALRRKVEGDEVHFELADIACNQVNRIERMLSDLLGYGKPLDLHLTPVRFAEVAKDVIELVRRKADEKGISIELEDTLGDRDIVADPEQLRRALTNLVVNAVYAVPRAGRVLVRAEISPDNPEQVAISVSDNGPGISEAQKGKLFQPFFTTREEGTGLGLSTVKKIAEYHGGSVRAENRMEGGAVFTIFLPIGEPSV